MKILFFSESFGPATFITRQVRQIAQHHEVRYACLTDSSKEADIAVDEIPMDYGRLTGKLRDRLEMHQLYFTFRNNSFSRKLTKVVRDFQPDIIHLQFGYEAFRFLDNFQVGEIPVIIHFRGYDASMHLKNVAYVRRLKATLNKKHVYSLSVCHHLINNLRSHQIFFQHEPTVIYSNTDTDFFKRGQSPSAGGKFALVQVSSFREKKGHLYTLKAIKKYLESASDDQIQLQFIGPKEGDTYQLAARYVAENHLGRYVQFMGPKNPWEVKEILEGAHCGFLHSVTPASGDQEGVPNALMEAMSMELPVISTRHAGIPELVNESVFGRLTDEKDTEAIAKAIAEVRASWRLAPENRQRVQELFSKEAFLTRIDHLYHQIGNSYAG